ncbi:hypothetical protein CL689_03570 [Candidatus Saccharibacteria bacterium]|nr:hypothetical protein [Candidatus Saccharibacteria bacterium]|tara:strand:+ start:2318 stop:2803 length:486 start_codon:yes stop_codon:yes gene_type:complete
MSTLKEEMVFYPAVAVPVLKNVAVEPFYVELSDLMGVPVTSPKDLFKLTLFGISPQVVNRLVDLGHGILDIEMVMPRRTLSHRQNKKENLTSDETGRTIRVAKVVALATQVFGGREKALRWLNRTHPVLDEFFTPLGLCRSEEGALLVLDHLNAVDHGFAA